MMKENKVRMPGGEKREYIIAPGAEKKVSETGKEKMGIEIEKEKNEIRKEKKKNEIEKTGKGNLPDEVRKVIPGTEEEEAEDMVIPRLKLLQSISTEVEEEISKAGVIKHSLSGEEWKSIQIIPICLRKSRILFEKNNPKGAPLCFSPDGKRNREGALCKTECQFDEAWRWKNNEQPRCPKALNFPCLVLKDDKLTGDFASATFMKSSFNIGQKLIYLRTVSAMPYWAFVYELASKTKKFKKGTAYVFTIKQIRKTTEEEGNRAEKIYNSIGGKLVTEEEVTEIE